jgi:hypothetical protein
VLIILEAVLNLPGIESIGAAVAFFQNEDQLEIDFVSLDEELAEPLSDLEEEVQNESTEVEDTTTDEGQFVSYSFADEQFFQEQQNAQMDYLKLWYGHNPATSGYEAEHEDETWGSIIITDATPETMSSGEAHETVQGIQYAMLFGTMHDVSFEARRRLANFEKFNKAELMLSHVTTALTQDVDYSRII